MNSSRLNMTLTWFLPRRAGASGLPRHFHAVKSAAWLWSRGPRMILLKPGDVYRPRSSRCHSDEHISRACHLTTAVSNIQSLVFPLIVSCFEVISYPVKEYTGVALRVDWRASQPSCFLCVSGKNTLEKTPRLRGWSSVIYILYILKVDEQKILFFGRRNKGLA